MPSRRLASPRPAAHRSPPASRIVLVGPGAAPRHRLVWFDAAGQAQEALSEPGDLWQVRLSPDDTQAAVTMLEPLLRTLDVYVLRGGSGSPLPVSLGLAAESDPVWSPDGLTLLFRSSRGGQPNLYTRRVGVQGAPETLSCRIARQRGSVGLDGRRRHAVFRGLRRTAGHRHLQARSRAGPSCPPSRTASISPMPGSLPTGNPSRTCRTNRGSPRCLRHRAGPGRARRHRRPHARA